MRGVGERALVAPLRDVQRDVPEHPEQRGDQRDDDDPGGDRRPGGQPGDALAEAADAPSSATLPERWPSPSHSSTAVTSSAAPEAIATWSSAAPPAGLAASMANMPARM